MPGLAEAIAEALRAAGVDLALVGAAWARATPLVVLVPAFGLRALPTPARVTLGIGFAAVIYPALATLTTPGTHGALSLALELARGLPLAIATAVPLWAATMAGGLVDSLRSAQNEPAPFTAVEGRATPLAILFSLAASFLFFASGGPARAVHALVTPPDTTWLAAASAVTAGITLAVSIAAPLLAAAIVLEVSAALIARAASPAHVDALLSPVKAIALLVFVALTLDRMIAIVR